MWHIYLTPPHPLKVKENLMVNSLLYDTNIAFLVAVLRRQN